MAVSQNEEIQPPLAKLTILCVENQWVGKWPRATIDIFVGIRFTWDVSQTVSEAKIKPPYLLLRSCSGSTNPSAKYGQFKKGEEIPELELTSKRCSDSSAASAMHLQRLSSIQAPTCHAPEKGSNQFQRRNRLVSAFDRPVIQKRMGFQRVLGTTSLISAEVYHRGSTS